MREMCSIPRIFMNKNIPDLLPAKETSFYFEKGKLTHTEIDGEVRPAKAPSLAGKIMAPLAVVLDSADLLIGAFNGFGPQDYLILAAGGIMLLYSAGERLSWFRKRENCFRINDKEIVFDLSSDDPTKLFSPPFRQKFSELKALEFQLYEIVFFRENDRKTLDLNGLSDDLVYQIYSSLETYLEISSIPFTFSALAAGRKSKNEN